MDMSLQLVILRCLIIQSLIRIRTSTAEQQLCNNMKPETGSVVNINMDTTQIIQQNGMCSCKLTVDNGAKISMYPTISSPNCITNIELIGIPVAYTFVCSNGKIATVPYINDHTTGDVFWLMVTSTVNIEHSLSGSVQIKSTPVQGGIADPTITVECYDPNMNSSSTTTTVAPPTTTTSTTTTVATTTSSTTTTVATTTTTTTTAVKTSSRVATTTKSSTTWPPVDVTTETTQQKSTPILTQSSSFSPTPDSGITVTVLVGGVVAGLVVAVIVISGFFLLRRCRKQHQEEHRDEDIIPVSESHPTYCGLTGGDNRVYDHIDTP